MMDVKFICPNVGAVRPITHLFKDETHGLCGEEMPTAARDYYQSAASLSFRAEGCFFWKSKINDNVPLSQAITRLCASCMEAAKAG